MKVEGNKIVKLLFQKTVAVTILLLIILISLFYYGSIHGINIGDFLSRTMVMATPLIFGTLGEIYVERSGVLNLGIEGMMATGAALGVIGAFAVGNPWGGVALAMIGSGIMALIFGVIAIKFRGMQVPAGLGLFLFGLGFSGVIGSGYVGEKLPYSFSKLSIPILGRIPIIGKFLFNQYPLGYIALILVPVMWFILFRTKIGLYIRSVGENPAAADSSGISVEKIRFLCVFLGGMLAGLAGAYLSVAWSASWTEGMSAGKGWIVIALTIFALWNPARALLGAWLFGGIFALKYVLQGSGIPTNILDMLPYLLTLIALSLVLVFSERIGAPSALMKPYERE